MLFSTKIFIFLTCSFAVVMALPADHLVGGVTKLSGDDIKDAEKDLQNSLDKLAAGDGPNYKISKVNSASSQIVSGRKIKMNVDLVDENDKIKNCNITIWSQPWLPNGIEVTFECPNEEKLVKKHSA